MRGFPADPRLSLTGLFLCLAGAAVVCATEDPNATAPTPAAGTTAADDQPALKDRILSLLPPAVSDGLEVDGWLWLYYLHHDQHSKNNEVDAQLSLDFTKSFGSRIATTFEGNLIDIDGDTRAELEQGFVSLLLSEKDQTLLTIGKFNANFGVEARDFWNRTNGTTSVIFGAQPQDLIGVMITQPLGDTGIKLRLFIAADFQGAYNFDQTPSAGIAVEYRPNQEWNFTVTNWVGPGMVLYGGRPLRPPYEQGGYGSSATSILGNWQGPNLTAESGSTLYFFEAAVTWQARRDLSFAAEYVMGTTSTSYGHWGWSGFLVQANFDITDKWNVFARYSYLDDTNWLITGEFQKISEVSAGIAYRFSEKMEVRAEYRHDHSDVTGSFDTVSLHLTLGF